MNGLLIAKRGSYALVMETTPKMFAIWKLSTKPIQNVWRTPSRSAAMKQLRLLAS